MLVRNKSIIKTFLKFCLNQERNMHRTNTVQAKTVQNNSKKNMWVLFWCESSKGDTLFFSGGNVIMDMDTFSARSKGLKVKSLNDGLIDNDGCKTCSFSLHKILIDGLESCGLLVDYYDVFYQLFGLSFWRHPFTAEDPLVSKWCNATFLQICSVEETNHLHLGWPEGEYISATVVLYHAISIQYKR